MKPSSLKKLETKVHFRADFETRGCEKVVVVGNHKSLGNWDVSKGHELVTTEDQYPSWFSPKPVYLPLREKISYKYVAIEDNGAVVRWENDTGENREIVPTGVDMTVEDDEGRHRAQLQSQYLFLADQHEDSVDKDEKDGQDENETKGDKLSLFRAQIADPQINDQDYLIVCAFELPVKISRSPEGGCTVSPGKSALLPTLHRLRDKTKVPIRFVGYPGITVEDPREIKEIEDLLAEYDCVPVFPPPGQLANFLHFCHHFLWPLFHNVVLLDTRKQKPFDGRLWACYQAMNKLFADVLIRTAHDGDMIWVHDFQLLLLPMHITRKLRRANVGLFLHVPFPSSEVFRCLPVREEILRGILCADLIGFHFYEYARHFLVACNRLLSIHHHFMLGGLIGIEYCGRNVVIRIGHVHIQPEDISGLLNQSPTRDVILRKAQAIRSRYEGKYIFASVDRCDRLAGLLLKIRSFENFLNNYAYAQGSAVLIQYAYPSIAYWDDVSEMRRELVDLVDNVNRSFHTEREGPLKHCQRSANGFYSSNNISLSASSVSSDCSNDLTELSPVTSKHKTRLDGQSESHHNHLLSHKRSSSIPRASAVPPENGAESASCWVEVESAAEGDENLKKPPCISENNEETEQCENHIELHVSEINQLDKLALFVAADCLLDTSIRDGLNLNPFEFICCHRGRPSSMIISEFTGCSRSLASAHRCNPWNVGHTAEKMDLCMRSSTHTICDSFLRDQNYVDAYSTLKWVDEFVLDLSRSRKPSDMVLMPYGFGNTFRVMGMDADFRQLNISQVVGALRESRNRLFCFDYEGTLAPDKRSITAVRAGAESLFSSGTPPSEAVKRCLASILSDQRNTVVILSGRNTGHLDEWFGDIKNIGMCAEHGFRFKLPSLTGDEWQMMFPSGGALFESIENLNTWRSVALELMGQYVKRTQGSFIENKGSALVFQYRDSDPDFGAMQAKELSNYLSEILLGYPVTVVSGKGYVEAKLRGVNKGNAVRHILQQLAAVKGDVDFAICIGDDRSDEPMFDAIAGLIEHSQARSGTYPDSRNAGLNKASSELASVKHKHFTSGRRIGSPLTSSGLNSTWSPSDAYHKSADSILNRSSHDLNDTQVVAERWFTCTVGKKPSKAKFFLNDPEEVTELLESIVKSDARAEQ